MIQTVDIPFRLPTLNEIIRLQSRMHKRTGHNEWNDLKHAVERQICLRLAAAKIRPVERIDLFVFFWRAEGRRIDKDNLTAGGRKVFFDALVAYGAIPNDGWKAIGDWHDEFELTDSYGVRVQMHTDETQQEIVFSG